MARRAQFVLLGSLCLSVISAAPVNADPIVVRGFIFVDDENGSERGVDVRLRIGSIDFEISIGGGPGGRTTFFPVEGFRVLEDGARADLSSRFVLRTTEPPTNIAYTANLTFTAEPSVLTDCIQFSGCSSSSRFEMSGTFAGADAAGKTLFDNRVIGSGQAIGSFQSIASPDPPDRGSLRFVSYVFDSEPAPIPEPATLLLLGSGAGVMVARKWWRGTRSEPHTGQES